MHRLILADLWDRRALWAWTLLCVSVAAACGSGLFLAISTALPAAEGNAEMSEGIGAVGANVVAYTLLAAVGVVGATVGLTMSAQAREHALWVVLGVPRRAVRRVLRVQLVAVGVLGGLVGVVPGMLVARAALQQWAGAGLAVADLAPVVQPWHPPATVGFSVLACLWGGWGATRRAARTPEMVALHESDTARARTGWLRPVLALLLLVGVGAVVAALATGEMSRPDDRAAGALAANLLLVAALLLVGGWVLRPLLWLWTALVPQTDPAWLLAKESCRARSVRSITTVLPFALALGLVGVFLGAGSIFGSGVRISELLLVFGWTLLVSWVGGVAVIAMVGRERGRDTALVVVAGARRAVIVRTVLYEGLVYAVTAGFFGLGATLTSIISTALVSGPDPGTAVLGAPWLMLGSLFLLTAVTTCAAVGVPAWRASSQSVVDVLRR